MVTEEIGLNEALTADGMKVTETDLGEYIIQLAEETPSHIIAPAIHKDRRDIAELFRAFVDAWNAIREVVGTGVDVDAGVGCGRQSAHNERPPGRYPRGLSISLLNGQLCPPTLLTAFIRQLIIDHMGDIIYVNTPGCHIIIACRIVPFAGHHGRQGGSLHLFQPRHLPVRRRLHDRPGDGAVGTAQEDRAVDHPTDRRGAVPAGAELHDRLGDPLDVDLQQRHGHDDNDQSRQ